MSTTYLVGRAGRDAEFQIMPSGDPMTKFSLAVDTDYDKEAKKPITTWYDVTVWDALAKPAAAITKGQRVWVGGQTSVFSGTSGDRMQIKARSIGLADQFFPSAIEDADIPEVAGDMGDLDGVEADW